MRPGRFIWNEPPEHAASSGLDKHVAGSHEGAAPYTEGQSARIGGLPVRAYVIRKGIDGDAMKDASDSMQEDVRLQTPVRSCFWPPGDDILIAVGHTHPAQFTRCMYMQATEAMFHGAEEHSSVLSQLFEPDGLRVAVRMRNL